MSSPSHWDAAFCQDVTTRGWYQTTAAPSWELIADINVRVPVVDVGAGASVWVDEALNRGFSDITVVDWSAVGLQAAQGRLGAMAASVTWIEADILSWDPPKVYGLWHDRAVLHFLLDDDSRDRYAQVLHAATAPGSVVVIGGFGPTGPDMCAGLPIRRQSQADYAKLLGPDFTIEQVIDQTHERPDGDTQDYLWVRAVRHA